MGLNYPPGVSGNEPEIAGYPNCGACGHEADDHNERGFCLYVVMLNPIQECGCQEYTQYPPEPDPDEERDRQLDAEWERRHAD